MENWELLLSTALTIATIILTSRKNQADRDRGLLTGALELVESLRQQLADRDEETKEFEASLEEQKKSNKQAEILRSLRASIERMERQRLEDQNCSLRVYCQVILGELNRIALEYSGIDIEIPEKPEEMVRKLSILIVSNNDVVIEQLKAMMPLYPYDLRIATSINDAQAMIESVHFDAVVIDWDMPSDGGSKAYKAIVETDSGPHVVPILVSGKVGMITTYKPITVDQAIYEILQRRDCES